MNASEIARALGRRGDTLAASGCPQRRRDASRRWEATLGFSHSKRPAALLTISAMPPSLAIFAGGRPLSRAYARSPVRCPGSIKWNREMSNPGDHLQTVGEIVQDLRALGLQPVLVGGMALVVLGSRRVTRDFDFVIAHPGDRLASTIAVFYDRGLELVSRLNDMGDVASTIANRRVAAIRLRLDAPASVVLLQRADRPSRRPPVRLSHSSSKARQTCNANQDSHTCDRHRRRAGPPAPQEDR